MLSSSTGKTVTAARPRLSVVDHQQRTVENFLQLRSLAPDLPIIPVVQGWRLDDYLACVAMYAETGIDLAEGAPRRTRLSLPAAGNRGDRRPGPTGCPSLAHGGIEL